MRLASYIPIHMCYNDKIYHRRYQNYYSAVAKTTYKWERLALVRDILEEYKVGDNLDFKKTILNDLEDVLTRVGSFWLNEIFKPVSETLELPNMTVCHCCNAQKAIKSCNHDIYTFSHYDANEGKLKVDLFAGPPTISVNVACQTEEDIERYKRYHIALVRHYQRKPCCKCCPISKQLIEDIDEQMELTVETLRSVE